MKNKLLFLLFLFSHAVFSQTTIEGFKSRILNETRELTIVTPPLYESDKDRKYPLIILLDGDYLVDPFEGILSYTTYWDDLPQAIIVGIGHESEESRRLDCETYQSTGLPQGKGDQFFQFIGSELVPYIEKKYRTASFRVIAGHGLTAGFINFFLYKEKPLFNAYICFSPELPTDMETRIPEILSKTDKQIFYYLATADGDVNRIKEKVKELNENIKVIENPKLKYTFSEFAKASHYSLVAFGIPEALYHIFSSYQPISSLEYEEKLVKMPEGHVDFLKEKYEVIEKELGVKMPIRLNDFKAIEAAIMKNAAYNELKELSSVAKKSYPKMIIGEYYEAMFYEMSGNLRKAKKVYLNSYTYEEIGEYTKDFMLNKAESLNVD